MKENKTGLEEFVGRHRADFDTFEPRPDLWDAIERDLAAATPAAEPQETLLRIVALQPESGVVAHPARVRPVRRYAMAAAVAVLLMAGLGGVWLKGSASRSAWLPTGAPIVAATPAAPAPDLTTDNPFGLGSDPVATAAAEAPAQRVTSAVLRMEKYYAEQIRERQTELNQLDAQLGAGPTDWKREMTALDSTYQQLKVELARNPEPDVVLDAMNRNLQIRLDILNQQLRTRAQVQEYSETLPKP